MSVIDDHGQNNAKKRVEAKKSGVITIFDINFKHPT